ncbi:MAG: hypothetical protein ACKVOP_05045 [Sphingomonadaceae bacterium]
MITAALTVGGGIATSVIGMTNDSGKSRLEVERDVCRMAFDAVGDEAPSPHLSKEQASAYISVQLRVIQRCNAKVK